MTSTSDVGEISVFLQHGWMFAGRGPATKGADPRICWEAGPSAGTGATTRIDSVLDAPRSLFGRIHRYLTVVGGLGLQALPSIPLHQE